ncbi:MAG: hypothetical protein HYZ00_12390, partial [Candidatus Hydrogenedentes bacterium]|nr:hypothetical protein [Candidatus Hydrogenedentota bacterium]
MSTTRDLGAGEELIKQDLITREELEKARAQEARTGTPWYRQLVQTGKLPFNVLEDVLWYEFHPKALRDEHQSLGDTLVATGDLTKDQLAQALAEQKRTGRLLGNVLVESGYISHEARAKALSRQSGMEYAPLARTPSRPEALEAVPENVAQKHQVIPVSVEGDKLTVLIVDPRARTRLNSLSVLLGRRLYPLLTASDNFAKEIES